jgi:hypothetical protein
MKRAVVTVVLVAVAAFATQPGWAAKRGSHTQRTLAASCAPPSEEEQAIRYMTDLMVASSACQNTIYGQFANRNRLWIIHYQNAMIARLRGKEAFDRWNTAIANQAAIRQASVPLGQFCQQSQPMLTQAQTLDGNGFRSVALAQIAATPKPPGCTARAQR